MEREKGWCFQGFVVNLLDATCCNAGVFGALSLFSDSDQLRDLLQVWATTRSVGERASQVIKVRVALPGSPEGLVS